MELYATPENPLPEAAAVHEVRTADGIALRAMTAPAAAGVPLKGTVVLLNGRADFLERYFETMRDFQRRGYAVAGFDWRGQGGSARLTDDPSMGYVKSFDQFDEDLRAVMTDVVFRFCPMPYMAVAHSTGGHIVLRNLFSKSMFARAVVTAPLLGLQYGNWPPAIAHALAHAGARLGSATRRLPGFHAQPFLLRDFADNPLTSDQQRWARDKRTLMAAPALGLGGPSYGWLSAALLSLAHLRRLSHRNRLEAPTLLVTAGLERVVDNRAAEDFVQRVHGLSSLTIREARHEIMMERDSIREPFIAAALTFLDAA